MIKPTAKIIGDKNLDRILKELGREAVKDSEIKRALKRIGKPIISSYRSNINKVTGNLSRSIGVIKGMRSKKGSPFILIGPRYYKPYAGQHAHLVEVGKEVYDVEYEGQQNMERAYESNKTQSMSKLQSELLQLLQKKLIKLKK